jgi:serine/threonine protein kinase
VESMDFEKEIRVTDFELGKRIGKGSFGEVYLVTTKQTNKQTISVSVLSIYKEISLSVYGTYHNIVVFV